MIKVRI